jgi:hypothetical protein
LLHSLPASCCINTRKSAARGGDVIYSLPSSCNSWLRSLCESIASAGKLRMCACHLYCQGKIATCTQLLHTMPLQPTCYLCCYCCSHCCACCCCCCRCPKLPAFPAAACALGSPQLEQQRHVSTPRGSARLQPSSTQQLTQREQQQHQQREHDS